MTERWSRPKRKRKWNALLPKLKERYADLAFCWMCGHTNALSFGHRLKRDLIHSDEELATVAILCTMRADGSKGCHQRIEERGHQVNYETVTNLIGSMAQRQ